MAKGVNKFIGIGRLGNDPEVRFANNGSRIANISIAIRESWKDKNTGQNQERTEWVRVVFFNRLAEIVEQYLTKGSHVFVEGKLETKKWTDNNGVDRYTTQIIAREMQMLGSRGDNAEPQLSPQPAQREGGAPVIDFDDGSIPF